VAPPQRARKMSRKLNLTSAAAALLVAAAVLGTPTRRSLEQARSTCS
jgi:hypothetical protein